MTYETSKGMYKKMNDSKLESENLLEQILSDVKPIISSSQDEKYNINEKPTELSSYGYVDYPGSDPSD